TLYRRTCRSLVQHSLAPLIYLLFLQSLRAHPHLHSFPTRRSSDLARSCSRWPTSRRSTPGGSRPVTSRTATRATPPPGRCGRRRSEEHTSELQSLRHLVCRLLLEKKNLHNYLGQARTMD